MTGSIDLRRSYPDDAMLAMMPAADGWPVRVFDRPSSAHRGSILWLGGRGDIIEKYLETLAGWHGSGWHVTSFDWRGQGGSGRITADLTLGHIDDFETWIADLAGFWSDWSARTPGPHVLMGHSMGGHLVLRALIERVVNPDAVVLSAPMLGFAGGTPKWLTAIVAKVLGKLAPTKRAWKQNERPAPADASRQAFLTHDADRYADELWWKDRKPELALGPPSWGWMAAAARSFGIIDRPGAMESVTTPVLIVGTEGDRLVSPRAMHDAARRLPHADLAMLDKSAAHEVLREVDAARDVLLQRIDQFLDVNAGTR
ncbi:MAG: alpha/beta hydrolase [Sphingomonadales bacterium]